MLLCMNSLIRHYTLFLVVVMLAFKFSHAAPQAEEGEPCRIKSIAGICMPGSKCDNLEARMRALGLTGRDVVSCGLTTWEELICCPGQSKPIEHAAVAIVDIIADRPFATKQPREGFSFPRGILEKSNDTNMHPFHPQPNVQQSAMRAQPENVDEPYTEFIWHTVKDEIKGNSQESNNEFFKQRVEEIFTKNYPPNNQFNVAPSNGQNEPLVGKGGITTHTETIFAKKFQRQNTSSLSSNMNMNNIMPITNIESQKVETDINKERMAQIFSKHFLNIANQDQIEQNTQQERTNIFSYPNANFGNIPQSNMVDEELRAQRIEEIFDKNMVFATESHYTRMKKPLSSPDEGNERMKEMFSNIFSNKDQTARSNQQPRTNNNGFGFPNANFGNMQQPNLVDEELLNRRMEEIFDKNMVFATENKFMKDSSNSPDEGSERMKEIFSNIFSNKDQTVRSNQQPMMNNNGFGFPSANFGNMQQPNMTDEELRNQRIEEIFDKSFTNNKSPNEFLIFNQSNYRSNDEFFIKPQTDRISREMPVPQFRMSPAQIMNGNPEPKKIDQSSPHLSGKLIFV